MSIDFTSRTMKVTLDTPEEKLQKCPQCGMGHPVYVSGYARDYHTDQIVLHPNKGYSFCNCKNLWYTDWKNIDQDEYAKVERSKTANEKAKRNQEIIFKTKFQLFTGWKKDIKSFLNIGGGSTFLEAHIREDFGWETTGVDINKTLDTTGHNLILGDIEKQETLDKLGKYDVVWTSHVLEHLQFPLKTLKNIKEKLLTEGGLLYITLPDPWYFNPDVPSSFVHWWTHQHHQLWNMDDLVKELLDMGYIIKVIGHEPNPIAKEFYIVASNPTKNETKFREFVKGKYKGSNQEIEVPIELIAPDDVSHNINDIDKDHREGADMVKKLIQEGKKILPIACNYYGRRTDGFKRYVAYKELGYKTLKIVISNVEGCQHKQPWVM